MTLHHQAQAFLDGLAEQGGPGWHELSPAEGREIFSSLTELFGEGSEVGNVEDRTIADNVRVRIYSPEGDGPFPGVVFFHGGGWVLGDLESHDAFCRRLTAEAEAVVVSVDYRRSPETVFPGAIEDCYTATEFVTTNAAELNIDAGKIVVAGDSAGGNLAAAVALRARDESGPKLCMQMLIYPVLDPSCDSTSYHAFAEGFGLSKVTMEWFWKQYLGGHADVGSPLIAPSKATSLAGLPATHLITAEYDVLRDEGEQFAQQLMEAGVEVKHRRYPGMLHGFMHFSGVFDDGITAISDVATAIRNSTSSAK